MAFGPGGCIRLGFKFVFVAAGPCLLVYCCLSVLETKASIRNGVTTQAIIVRLQAVPGRKSGTTYAPVFTFMTEDGRPFTMTSRTSSNPPAYRPGQVATVYYPHGEPQMARLDSFFDLWFSDLIIAFFGVIITLIGLASLFSRRRRRRTMVQSAINAAINNW
jgi:Protein of unknown function (DUF3592)